MKVSQEANHWVADACPTGKRSYFTRRAAKAAVKRLRNTGGQSLGCYQCDPCGHWHVGHRPLAVTRGVISKDRWLTPPG